MDSGDELEMADALLTAHATATAEFDEHLAIITCLVEGHAPPCKYEINGHAYDRGYYIADGIYPRWSTFIKTISNPLGQNQSHFVGEQEGA